MTLPSHDVNLVDPQRRFFFLKIDHRGPAGILFGGIRRKEANGQS